MLRSSALHFLTDAVTPLAEGSYQAIGGLVCALLLLTLPLELGIPPLARKFRLDNPYINYPRAVEHVPIQLLALLTVILPLSIITVVGVMDKRYRMHSAVSILGLLLSLSVTLFVTDILKFLIGNQRPDFLARCIPKEGTPQDQLVAVLDVCTNQNTFEVWEGCRSTPSGHSSLSFAGLGFLALWIIFTFDKSDRNSKYVNIVSASPILISIFIALTRIVDHMHHWLDIISGCLIGSTFAWYSYKYAVGDSKPENIGSYSAA